MALGEIEFICDYTEQRARERNIYFLMLKLQSALNPFTLFCGVDL